MGTKFAIVGDAVNRHAGNLDGSVADLNANLQQFINALAGLPVRPWVAARHLVQAARQSTSRTLSGIRDRDDGSSILGLDPFSTFDRVKEMPRGTSTGWRRAG
jgi:hypothetical protein